MIYVLVVSFHPARHFIGHFHASTFAVTEMLPKALPIAGLSHCRLDLGSEPRVAPNLFDD